MSKKEICISFKTACIIGLILSLVFAVITSYVSAAFIVNTRLVEEKLNVFSLGNILIPILFVVFGIFALVFTIVCGSKNSNK